MAEQEGVLKFQLRYKRSGPIEKSFISELNAWRTVLFRLNLIGQDPSRYGGFGFGNISRRMPPFRCDTPEQIRFIITGTQTGSLETLSPKQYTTVTGATLSENCVSAEGPVEPSSEALTHAAVYAADNGLRFIFHVHCPQIWQRSSALALPFTDPDIPYGTVEMARAVTRLIKDHKTRKSLIFSMLGHEDGIVSFGRSAEEAGCILVHSLARALAVD